MPGGARARTVDAVLLDALGTLIALQAPWPALVRELGERHECRVSETDARRALEAEMAYYRAHHHEGNDPDSLTDLRWRCAGVLRDGLPGTAGELDLDAVTDALLRSLRFTPYPEVPEALKALRTRGVTLVVVSNWDVSLHQVLDRTGVAQAVDGVLTSAEVGACKPAPAIFLAALELVGVTPARALHVGDSVEHDVTGARAAGVEPVLVHRGPGAGPLGSSGAGPLGSSGAGSATEHHRSVRTISSLAELAGLVASGH